MLGAAVQKTAQRFKQFGLVQQKGVVSVVGRNLDKADIGRRSIQCVDDLSALEGREKPVAGERDDAKPRACSLERVRQRTVVFGREVEIVHCTGDVEIGVRVEAVDKRAALMAKIAFDLEIGVEAIGDGKPVLQV